jgi:hypothetical protein
MRKPSGQKEHPDDDESLRECLSNDGTHGSTLHTMMQAHPETYRTHHMVDARLAAQLPREWASWQPPTGQRAMLGGTARSSELAGSATRPLVFFCKSFITALLITVLPFRRAHARNFKV